MNRHFATTIFTSLTACLGACSDGSITADAIEPAPLECGSEEPLQLSQGSTGDFSSDPLLPTTWPLGVGVNEFRGGTRTLEEDYVTFNVSPCDSLDSITIGDYNSVAGDPIFMAIQRGSTFTVLPEDAATSSAEFLGYTEFDDTSTGQNLLELANLGEGAIGFNETLPAGDYTIWFNQQGEESLYTLFFNVSRVLVPQPE